MLASKGYPIPRATKTGTTIAGIIFKDGVILGADTRATNDTIVADKNCMKIHYLAPNMYCCGAGTAADCDYVTKLISSQLELHALNTGKQAPVCAANRMLKQYLFRYQGHVSAALVLGGVDKFGPKLISIHPHGSTDSLPFTTMGSGSLAAMAVFEAGWREDMDRESGKKLVRDAIAAGVFNDLGSGSNIDLCIITQEGVEYIRPYDEANKKGVKQGRYVFPKGSTAVLESKVLPLVVEDVMVMHLDEPVGAEAMDES
jgi:20S proteasome subunit beta 2